MATYRRKYPSITFSKAKSLYRATQLIGGRRKDVYGHSEEDVMNKIDALLEYEERGVSSDMTLEEYAMKWLPVKTAGLKYPSREAYTNALSNHIFPRFGKMKLSEIKPLHIDRMLADMKNFSSSLCSKVLFTSSQIFDSAIENDLIQRNPCRGRKAGGVKPKKKTPLTKEQQEVLCEAVRGTRAELFVLLCLYAGLRREEALGLLWGDVHLGNTPYIDVRHTTTFVSNGKPTHSSHLKSKAAYRTIPIPPQLSEALKRSEMVSIFVCPTVGGKVMTLSAFRRMWETVKVDFYASPHILRHTYITELCASGMDIKQIQYLAGHATVQMTLDIYTHVTRNRPEQLAPAIIKTFCAGKSAGCENIKSV